MVISSSFSLGRFGTHLQAAEDPVLFLGCPCLQEGENCLSFSLEHCQKARPGLTICSGQGEGRRRLGQQWLFLPCLWMVVQS